MRSESVSIFVDDYITGRLPGVCTVTGEPTADRLGMSTEIDGPSPAWFILLFFPVLGWLVLLAVMLGSRRSYLTGELPMSAAAYGGLRTGKRRGGVFAVAAIVLLVVATAGLAGAAGPVIAIAAVALAIAAAVMYWRTESGQPRVKLDGSRRWVSVGPVHPNFATAVREQAARTRDLA